MSVIRQGPNQYISTWERHAFGSQKIYDTAVAAERADDIASQGVPAMEKDGQELLDNIPTAQLRNLGIAVEAEAERTRGYAIGEVAIRRVLERYPAYFDPDGADTHQQSFANKAKVRGFMEAKGLREGVPPTEFQLDSAVRELVSRGALYLKPGATAPELSDDIDEAALYSMPMSQLERKVKGWE